MKNLSLSTCILVSAIVALSVNADNITNYPQLLVPRDGDLFFISSIPDKTNYNFTWQRLKTNMWDYLTPAIGQQIGSSNVVLNNSSGNTLSGTWYGDGTHLTLPQSTVVAVQPPLGAVTNGNLTTITGTNLATLADLHVTGFNLDSFGTKHDVRRLVGSITAGSATVNLSSGSVSADDVGDMVHILLGAATNIDMGTVGGVAVTIVSTNTPYSFQLSRTCGNTIATAEIYIAKTDDTLAFQAGLNALQYGGGTLLISPGLYCINGPVIDPGDHHTHTNAQLFIPPLVTTYSINRGIVLNGAGGGKTYGVVTGNNAVASNVTMFISFLQTQDNGALLGCPPLDHFHGAIEIRDMDFRVSSNPDTRYGAVVDLYSLASAIMSGVYIDAGCYLEYDTRIPWNDYDGTGLWFPASNNSGGGKNRIESTTVFGGFRNGFKFSEHVTGVTMGIVDCYSALTPASAPSDVTFFQLGTEGCPNVVTVSNNAWANSVVINNMHYENASPIWWATNKTFINDPGSRLVGEFRGDFFGTTNIGATNISMGQFGGSDPISTPPTYTWAGNHGFGTLHLTSRPSTKGWPTIETALTNGGLIVSPDNDETQSQLLTVRNRHNTGLSDADGFDIYVRSDRSEVSLSTTTSGGGSPLGRPIRFYPVNRVWTNGFSLSLETNEVTVIHSILALTPRLDAPAAGSNIRIWNSNNFGIWCTGTNGTVTKLFDTPP